MRLALGSRDADKVVLRQARRQLEHRPGDGDVVVMSERRKTLTGALLTGARRFASSARAFASISSIKIPNTSSNRPTCWSL
jgi:hypothetical protein